MKDSTTPSGDRPQSAKQSFDKIPPDPSVDTGGSLPEETGSDTGVAPRKADLRIPILTIRQKYIPPSGRHSQQTHRRAQERAEAQGLTTRKEQHAYDRNVVMTELNRQSAQKQKQQSDRSERSASAKAPKESAQSSPPENEK